MQYTVVLRKGDDGRYSVEIPALPGCFTYGNDVQHAMEMAQDAVECHVESLILDNLPVPAEDRRLCVPVGEADETIIRKIVVEEPVGVA